MVKKLIAFFKVHLGSLKRIYDNYRKNFDSIGSHKSFYHSVLPF